MKHLDVLLRWCGLRFAPNHPNVPSVVVDWLHTGDKHLKVAAMAEMRTALHSNEYAVSSWGYVSDAIWSIFRCDGEDESVDEVLRLSAAAVVAVQWDTLPSGRDEWDVAILFEATSQRHVRKLIPVISSVFEQHGLGAIRFQSVEKAPWVAGQIYKALNLPDQEVVAQRIQWMLAQG